VYDPLLKKKKEDGTWQCFKCCEGSREMQTTESDTCIRQTVKAMITE